MSASRSRIIQVASAVMVVVAISACSSDLGGPDRPQPGGPAMIQYPPQNGPPPQLFAVDADGTSYTLDIPTREIRMSNGGVLVLDSVQVREAAEAFSRINATDTVASAVSQFTYNGCGPYACAPINGSAEPPSVSWLEHVRGRHTASLSSHMRATTPVFSFASALLSTSGDHCSDVANVAVSAVNAYASARTSFITEIWPVAIISAGSLYLRRLAPAGTSIGAKLEQLLVEHYNTSTQVNILAFYWNSYGCASKNVVAGPVYLNSGSGTGTYYSCEYQTWQISFDNWKTSSFIQVKVCYYKAT